MIHPLGSLLLEILMIISPVAKVKTKKQRNNVYVDFMEMQSRKI